MQRPFDIEAFLSAALMEDIGAGDLTCQAVVPADAAAMFVMRARQEIRLAGAAFLPQLFALIDPSVTVKLHAQDGDRVTTGGIIATLEGPARALLMGERTALNLLQQLSGVATLTSRYVAAVEGTGARVLDTRKTIPGLRYLQKYAVRCGGGHNHRMGLFDAVMIKDNHIAIAGSVTAAVKAAKQHTPPTIVVEVECDTLNQVREAIGAGATMLLLDNMDLATLREAVALCKKANVTTEASGTVTLDTIRAIAQTGVDTISVGKLTHSAVAVDIGMDEQ